MPSHCGLARGLALVLALSVAPSPAEALSRPLLVGARLPPLRAAPCRAAPPAANAAYGYDDDVLPAVVPERPPERQKSGGGLTLAVGGLLATLLASASALSMTGLVATVAASAAGLFSFKVSKELNRRGYDRRALSKARGAARPPGCLAPLPTRPHALPGQAGNGVVWRFAALVIYSLASVVSFGAPPPSPSRARAPHRPLHSRRPAPCTPHRTLLQLPSPPLPRAPNPNTQPSSLPSPLQSPTCSALWGARWSVPARARRACATRCRACRPTGAAGLISLPRPSRSRSSRCRRAAAPPHRCTAHCSTSPTPPTPPPHAHPPPSNPPPPPLHPPPTTTSTPGGRAGRSRPGGGALGGGGPASVGRGGKRRVHRPLARDPADAAALRVRRGQREAHRV